MSKAAERWRKKLDYLLAEEVLASGEQKFALQEQIEESEAKLRELGEDSAARPEPVALSSPRLPPRPPRCHGRKAEVDALVAALCAKTPSPTPLLGGPGMGKSTISLEALHDKRVAQRFGARRFFVRLEAAASGEAMVRELARGVGVEVETGGGDLVGRVLGELKREPAALMLDNLETPWWADQGTVEELLAQLGGVPSLALAVSLRGGKRPLKIRWGKTIEVGVLPPAAARRTFLEIAGEHLGGDPNLVGLLQAVDHVALAVELLAHQAEDEPDLAGLRRRWDRERTKLLQVGKKEDRLLNLGASLELSIQSGRMIEIPAARRLLALLGILPDGIALEDLPAVLEDGDAAAGCLRQVGLAAGRDERRLQLLAPVREHAAERCKPEADDLTRAGRHYLKLASLGNRAGRKGGAEAIARLSPELNNLEVVITRELESSEPGPAADAAVALGWLFCATGLGEKGLLERAEKAAREAGDGQREADCIKRLSDIAFYRSEHAEARSRYEQALPLYQRVGDLLGEANCIKSLGNIALDRSEHAEARSRYERALPLYQRVGDLLGEANCIRSLGDIALRRSEHAEARSRYEQVLPLYQRVGSLLGEANCIKSLGDIALRRSEHAEARSRYEQALPLYQRVGDLLGEANCIRSLGDIALRRSEHAEARSRYEQALPLFQRVGDLLGEANCILGLGDIALARSEHAEARSRYEQALPLHQRVGDLLGEANCIQSLGDIALRRSEHAEARSRYEQALPLYQRVGSLLGEANCMLSLGEMTEAPAEARRLAGEALALYGRLPEPYSMARAHVALARLAEDPVERRRQVVAARELRERIDWPDLVEALRREFGEEAEALDSPSPGADVP